MFLKFVIGTFRYLERPKHLTAFKSGKISIIGVQVSELIGLKMENLDLQLCEIKCITRKTERSSRLPKILHRVQHSDMCLV